MGRTGKGISGGRKRGLLVLAALAAFGVAGCGGEDAPTEPVGGSVVSDDLLANADLGGAISEVTQSLGLSDEQLAKIQELAARSRDQEPEPGAAWYAAAELQTILSSDQIAALGNRLENSPGRIRMERGERSGNRDGAREHSGAGSRPGGKLSGGGHGYAWLDLTEQQQAQIQAILESHQAEIQALREDLRASDLSPDEMRSRAEAVREAVRAEIEPLLTQEQRDRLQEREAGLEQRREAAMEKREVARQRGEAEHAAMVDALGLTDAQIEQMEELRQDRGAHREAFAEILTDDQLEVVAVHRALEAHRFRTGRPDGHARGAGRRSGGEGRSMGTGYTED